MKRKPVVLLAALALAIGFASLTAQEASKPKTANMNTITVTGCLEAGTAPDSFTLTNVTQSAQKSSATGTAGTATATATATAEGGSKPDTKYDLSPDASVNLKPHVGHKVEITGTPDMKGATGTSGATATAEAPGKSGAAAKKLTVTAVKHISPSCS